VQVPRPSGRQVEISRGRQVAVVTEVGACIREYRSGNRQVLDGFAVDQMCSAGRGQHLLPWPNRIADGAYEFGGEQLQLALTEPQRHNAIHGLVRWVNWQIADRDGASVRMEYRLHPQPGYPFLLDLALDISLEESGISVTTTATNLGDVAAPFAAGAHPYLRLGEDGIDGIQMTVPASQYLKTDERLLPERLRPVEGTAFDFRTARLIGDTVMDTALTTLARDDDGRARVVMARDDQVLTLWMDDSYQWLMLFTGDGLPEPQCRRGLGVEPMTAPPDAFRSGDGLMVLEPSERFAGRWGIDVSGLG